MSQIAGFGGRNDATAGGRLPSTIGPPQPAPEPAPRSVRAAGFGPETNSTTHGARLPGTIGGPNAGPATVGELLDVPGFALVVKSGGERERYAAVDGASEGLTTLDVTMEANALASWSATLPADRELFNWAFADVVIGHDGERIFHGQLLPAKGSRSDNEVTVSGHGRLFQLTSGGIRFEVQNEAGWEAITRFWEFISEWADGQIRGYAVEPPPGTEHRIGDEPMSFEGTPMSVAKELHGQFNYLFVLDHTSRTASVESFRPPTQARPATWTATGHDVTLDPTSYHNHVVIRGAKKPDASGRYVGEAIAPEEEIQALTNGELITAKPKPDPELDSSQAVQSRAQSLLAELRGQYSITGSVEATPVGVLPGYLYQVPQFNSVVPEVARPVRVPLQTVTHTLVGGPTTSLDFSGPDGLVQAIRRSQNPALAPENIARRQPGLFGDGTDGDGNVPVYNSTYPHPYGGN